MFGTGARYPPGDDFPPLCRKIAQGVKIFVIDFQVGIATKAAKLPAMEVFFRHFGGRSGGFGCVVLRCHGASFSSTS